MAEASTFYLEIITPERQFYIGPAEALVFPAVDGEMGVYPGHEPAVTAVEPGELRYKVDGKWEPAAVGAGFVEIKPDYVILLVGFAEHPERSTASGPSRPGAGRGTSASEAEHPRVLPLQGGSGPGHGPPQDPQRVIQPAEKDCMAEGARFPAKLSPLPPCEVSFPRPSFGEGFSTA